MMPFYTDAELLQCVGSASLSGGLPETRGSRDPVALALLIALQLSLNVTFASIARAIQQSHTLRINRKTFTAMVRYPY